MRHAVTARYGSLREPGFAPRIINKVSEGLPVEVATGVSIKEAIEALRLDVARWKVEIALLECGGNSDFGRRLSAWIEEAERIIGKSENPHA